MTSLKELKSRLKGIQSTQKVTSAMRVVAAAKFRSARLKMDPIRVYHAEMFKILQRIADNISSIEHPPFIFHGRIAHTAYFDPWAEYHARIQHQKHTALLIIISSDRGLCAGYNTSLLKKVRHWIKEHQNIGYHIQLLCIGRKGYEALKKEYGLYIIHHVPLTKIQEDQQKNIENLVSFLEDLYSKHEFDYADIAYTSFKNTLVHSVNVEGILPLNRLLTSSSKETNIYEFEPSLEEMTPVFLQEYFKIHLIRLLYESFTSENAARMTAMDNASRNAQKIINQLTLIYNRTRQAHITTEITEIISGAEAV